MKIHKLLQELQGNSEYKIFQSQNPDSFFAAAFLILDLKNTKNQIQLDFFLPSKNKIAAFSYPFISGFPNNSEHAQQSTNPKIHDDKIENMQPQTTSVKIDIENLESVCNKIIKENESQLIPTKIIAIL